LYELERAEFGPIGEMACIIGEYDPLIAKFCKKENFAPELKKKMIDKD
jgi:hypothetical protein